MHPPITTPGYAYAVVHRFQFFLQHDIDSILLTEALDGFGGLRFGSKKKSNVQDHNIYNITGWRNKNVHFKECITPTYDDVGRRPVYQNVRVFYYFECRHI